MEKQIIIAEGIACTFLYTIIVRKQRLSTLKNMFWPVTKGEIEIAHLNDNIMKELNNKKVRVILEVIE